MARITAIAAILAMIIAGCAKKNYLVTSTGVRYEILREGTGPTPKRGDSVMVNYTGWLEDGTKFDSSVDKNEPFTFRIGIGQVIQGWDDGIMTMKAGGKSRFVIPPELAYGDRSVGPIPPHATLTFEVELVKIW